MLYQALFFLNLILYGDTKTVFVKNDSSGTNSDGTLEKPFSSFSAAVSLLTDTENEIIIIGAITANSMIIFSGKSFTLRFFFVFNSLYQMTKSL
jgi:hypothetical protein